MKFFQFARRHSKILIFLGLLLVEESMRAQVSAVSEGAAFVNGVIFALGLDIFFAGLVACFVKAPL